MAVTPADVREAFALSDWWSGVTSISVKVDFVNCFVPFGLPLLGFEDAWKAAWLKLMFVGMGLFFTSMSRSKLWHRRAMAGLDGLPPVEAVDILSHRINARSK